MLAFSKERGVAAPFCVQGAGKRGGSEIERTFGLFDGPASDGVGEIMVVTPDRAAPYRYPISCESGVLFG